MASLTDDGSRVIESQVVIHRTKAVPSSLSAAELDDQFDIPSCIESIAASGATRVALQFPDELLEHATAVSSRLTAALQEKLNHQLEFFILADTTFDSCVVDEVAALHANAQLIIHFGYTMLANAPTLPSYHVLGKRVVDTAGCVKELQAYVEEVLTKDTTAKEHCTGVILLFDTDTYHSMPTVWKEWCGNDEASSSSNLPRTHQNVTIATIPQSVRHPTENNSPVSPVTSANVHHIHGMEVQLPDGDELRSHAVFLVGDIDSPIVVQVLLAVQLTAQRTGKQPTQLLKVWNGKTDCNTDAEEVKDTIERHNTWVQRRLQRRWFLVEKIKECEVIGIVAASCGVMGQAEMIQRLRRTIKKAGKKAHVLMVGKPNVPKLANFDEIDAFVLVASVSGTLLDDKEFPKPILTPLETILGLMPFLEVETEDGNTILSLSETSKTPTFFDMDFRSIMTHPLLLPTVESTSQAETAEVSLTSTKKVFHIGKKEEAPLNACTTVAVTGSSAVVQYENPTVERFKQRTFQGLDPEKHQADKGFPTTIVEGLSGVASRYNNDLDTMESGKGEQDGNTATD
eukprot:TRINITY_DN57653_c0_g1_i1.p1 TRINITY_DN57653_c0_g1~~TRINITY_DN57653_c0_g1_i1.p1  ORF type:complete len:571 (-),score=44.33 TRINITY_DN57653_c0_g1_i1:22-1734(-)